MCEHDFLRAPHILDGYECQPVGLSRTGFRSGQWAFMVQKGGKRLMVAIREASAVVAPESAIGAAYH
jgi:hypothetical protein